MITSFLAAIASSQADFRIRICHSKNNRIFRHAFHHIRRNNISNTQSNKYICIFHCICSSVISSFALRKFLFHFIKISSVLYVKLLSCQTLKSFHVLHPMHSYNMHTGHGCSACAIHNKLCFFNFFLLNFQCIQ